MTRITTVLVVMLLIAILPGRNAQAQERTIKSKYEFGTPELDVAQKLYSGRKYPEALAAFQAIIDKAQATNSWEEIIYTMEKKALSLRRLERYDEAIETMNEAIDLALEKLPKEHFLVSKMYYTRGTTDHTLRDFYNARAFLDTALIYYNNSPTYDSSAYYRMVEYKYYAYQNSEGSSDTLLKYLDKLKELEEVRQKESYRPDKILNILQGYPTIYIQKGDFEEALAFAIQGYKFAKENKGSVSPRFFAEAKFYLAQVLYYKKDNKKALEIALEAMPIVESTPRREMPEYYAFNNLLGLIYMGLNEYGLALSYFQRMMDAPVNSRNVFEKRDNSIFLARLMINLGLCYDNLGDKVNAKLFLDKSLSEMKKLISFPSQNFHNNYEQLGDHYYKNSNWSSALIAYDSALRNGLAFYEGSLLMFPDSSGENSYSYADLKTLSKKAATLRYAAINEEDPKEKLLASKSYVEQTHKILMSNRGELMASEGKLFLSENFKSLYETGIDVCYELYELTGDKVFFESALSFSKQSKAILFLEQSQEFELVNNDVLSQDMKESFFNSKRLIDQLQNSFYELISNSITSDSVISLNEKLLEARIKNRALRDNIETILSNYRGEITIVKEVLDIEEKRISEGQALIEYFYGEDNIFILSKSKERSSFSKLDLNEKVEEALTELIGLVSRPPDLSRIDEEFDSFKKHSILIYELLINSVLDDLGNDIKHLIIVPDEFLSRLPFEILVQGNDVNSSGFNELNYLTRSYSIQYELSSELLNGKPNKVGAEKGLLGIGFRASKLSNSRSGFGALPGTEKEINFLKGSVKGDYLIGNEGTKSDFLRSARDYDILHLAVHGEADSTNRYQSSLIFNGGGENNILNTNDLYLAGLKSRLAVLSACESGVGVLNKGEGTFSIARGFALVGVPSLVMSLWKVNDQITSTIMVDMYKGFINEGYPINEALRKAKLSYLESSDSYSSHPYYWAAFLQLGENTELNQKGKSDSTFVLTLSITIIGVLLILLLVSRKRKRAN